nr:MAG TPA: hypothetical protein [Caudoviricetes sp.]
MPLHCIDTHRLWNLILRILEFIVSVIGDIFNDIL